MKKICFAILFTIYYLQSTIDIAHAQEVTLAVAPPVTEIILAPNKKVTQTFTFQHGAGATSGLLQLRKIIPTDNLGHTIIDPTPLIPSSLPLTITSKNQPLDSPFPLKGDQTAVTLEFEAASSDVTQDLYFALVFQAITTDSFKTSSTSVPGISSLVLITITPSGVLPINLEIKDFETSLIHDSWNLLTISPTLINNTSTMIRPQGQYEIISPSGKTVLSLPLYPNLILGNASRRIFTNIADQPADVSWSPRWSDVGPYRMRLTITSQGGTKLSETEKVVWIVPVRILIIACLIILLSAVAFLRNVRKRPQAPIDSE
jgi:hypothetical protein